MLYDYVMFDQNRVRMRLNFIAKKGIEDDVQVEWPAKELKLQNTFQLKL